MAQTSPESPTPVQHTGDATGGPSRPFEKSMDKTEGPKGSTRRYDVSESVPPDGFHEEAGPGQMENPQDKSKRFSG